MPGILFGGPFAAVTQRRCAAWKARGRRVACGTTVALSGPLGDSQAIEDWIHEQDVRRGGAAPPTPAPDPQMVEALWVALKRFAARSLAIRDAAVIELTDGTRSHRVQTGGRGPLARSTTASPDITVSGQVGELLLYATGRPADIDITGDERVRSTLASHDWTV